MKTKQEVGEKKEEEKEDDDEDKKPFASGDGVRLSRLLTNNEPVECC